MKCSAPTKCEFSCTGGNCKTVICEADTCEESCTGGGCSLECHGKSCEQSCTKGDCQLQCAYNAEKCEQRCTINKDKCTIEDYVPDECDSLDGGVCIQSCTGGECSNMECFNSPLYYDSCEQSCTGECLHLSYLLLLLSYVLYARVRLKLSFQALHTSCIIYARDVPKRT